MNEPNMNHVTPEMFRVARALVAARADDEVTWVDAAGHRRTVSLKNGTLRFRSVFTARAWAPHIEAELHFGGAMP